MARTEHSPEVTHENGQALIKALTDALTGGQAHATLEDALKDLPADLRGVRPEGLPYSIWQLLEHIRITQWDILEFSTRPDHQSPKWPDEYWPKEAGPDSASMWTESIKKIQKDRDAFVRVLKSPDADLFRAFPHGDGQNLVREAILIIDHTSYHTGEIIAVRRMLGAWK